VAAGRLKAGDVAGFLLLANAAAGSADEPAIAAARDELASAGDVEVVATEGHDDLDRALDARHGRTLVVCGGDGSLHVVVDALWRRGELASPVGLVPLGTGNDLARGVGLPFDDAAAAARRIRDGRPRSMDLLVADDGQVCVNALHAGVGADAAARAEAMKSTLSELAYPLGALLAGMTAEGVATRVEVDGEVVADDDVLLVAVCNGPGFGGGTPVAPDADPSDGRLDVVVVTAVGALDRAAFGLALQRGTHLDRDDVHLARGRQVTIDADGLVYDVDGEVGDGRQRTRTWRVEPSAWRLLGG
jgi:YegS/Rv2252/BmrU family lipid kinase